MSTRITYYVHKDALKQLPPTKKIPISPNSKIFVTYELDRGSIKPAKGQGKDHFEVHYIRVEKKL